MVARRDMLICRSYLRADTPKVVRIPVHRRQRNSPNSPKSFINPDDNYFQVVTIWSVTYSVPVVR